MMTVCSGSAELLCSVLYAAVLTETDVKCHYEINSFYKKERMCSYGRCYPNLLNHALYCFSKTAKSSSQSTSTGAFFRWSSSFLRRSMVF